MSIFIAATELPQDDVIRIGPTWLLFLYHELIMFATFYVVLYYASCMMYRRAKRRWEMDAKARKLCRGIAIVIGLTVSVAYVPTTWKVLNEVQKRIEVPRGIERGRESPEPRRAERPLAEHETQLARRRIEPETSDVG